MAAHSRTPRPRRKAAKAPPSGSSHEEFFSAGVCREGLASGAETVDAVTLVS